MRATRTLATVGLLATLSLGLAACGGGAEPAAPAAPAPSSSAAAAPAADGVTTNDDVVGPACGQLPQGDEPGSLDSMGPQPVATAASTNPLLTTLVTAVGKVPGLADTLNQQQAITVFAPANDAFTAVQQQLGEEKFNALLADTDQLQGLLSYHVTPERLDAAGLVQKKTLTELAGGDLTIGGTAEAPTVTDGQGNTANVLCGNIPTANATVFVIDKVLMPKAG
ncbi:putative lipoprotein [Pseudonocardia sp. Ae168_Ps1]|uniref:fasciclin domain-containing protein n=1 Tax=unclassified Pseudonocardia TaxID=2619320 RepID=UPI0001FFDF48|nr:MULTISPECIES: fasciclin domain-containing protein [unclassified Pseudonocardia]OLL73045.1 putative lipoprotein [Pseudonocardia sp. Ae150A_Ps1]OLL79020.1 putative lipoprotein [Pseudonocardia sp. Ae168_Ps1]OLL86842.1 putative lipoprotein [Pseudonocardia sp. Ae263_Ps1]OLL93114.1 putative lipoprotein [Pseudonocardia sp. Ae356_Ps1]OLM19587.1 putative lipoprotein [Pseudonocardia sp. Ae707_Ps1]